MARKLHYNTVKSAFEARGYTLLEDEYIMSQVKMRYSCPFHPREDLSITYSNLQQGQGCPLCRDDARKVDFQSVIAAFESRGHTLLSVDGDYKNNKSKLRFKCHAHPHVVQYKTYDSIRHQGCGCKLCSDEIRSSGQRLDYETVIYRCTKAGYTLVSTTYVNNNTNLELKCDKHGNFMSTIARISEEQGCPKCGIERRSGENHLLWKGGITPALVKARNSPEYASWRAQVFARDQYTCKCCGIHGTYLTAHHLENFAHNEHLRFDIDNGVTLCKKCHNYGHPMSFHSMYGTKNNTRSEFEAWITLRLSEVSALVKSSIM